MCNANTAQDVIDSQKCLAQHHLPKVHGDSVKKHYRTTLLPDQRSLACDHQGP